MGNNLRSHLLCLFLGILLILNASLSQAADYYWVGGSGDWSDINHWATTSGGTVTHFTVPSPGDDVHFDANSFTGPGQVVNLNLNIITCRDLNVSLAAYQPSFFSISTTKLEIYGSLLLRPDINFQVNSEVHFLASSSGHLIRTAGKGMLSNVYFSGPGGGWALADTLKVPNHQIHLQEGTLNTAGQTVVCNQFVSNYSFNRTLNLSSSHIYVAAQWICHSSGLTVYAGSSRIFLSGAGASFQTSGPGSLAFHRLYYSAITGTATLNTGAVSFNRVEFATGAILGGNVTYGDLILAYGKKYYINTSSTHTFLDSLYAQGHCLSPIRLECPQGTANFVKASGSITVEYAEIKGIVAGGGGVFNALASADLGGNTGWQFLPAPPRTLYWVGGAGEWGDTAHWSAGSGGPGGECPPTASDDVVFNALSFASTKDTVVLDGFHAHCRTMTWQPSSLEPVFFGQPSRTLHIWGSLELTPGMHWDMQGAIQFESTLTGNTIKSADHSFLNYLEFKGMGGGWTLLDSLSILGNNIVHTRGHLNTGGQKVKCARFVSTEPFVRELSLGASKVELQEENIESFELNGSFFTLNAGTSEITLSGKDAIFFLKNNSNLIFHNLTLSNDSGSILVSTPGVEFNRLWFYSNARIVGDTEIDSLLLSTGKTYVIQAQSAHTIGTLVAAGNCNHPVLLETDSLGYTATLNMGPDTSKVFDLIIQDLVCNPDSMIVANNSVGLGKTSGWLINERPEADFYWIGGTGHWSDSSHWSNSSGGVAVNCLPSPVDNVIFDNNSFLTPSDTVFGYGLLFCRDVRWINTIRLPLLKGSDGGAWRIHGSMLLSDSMSYAYGGTIAFMADTLGKTVITRNHTFLNDVTFHHPDGGWTLLDSLIIECQDCALSLLQGKLKMRDRDIRIPNFRSMYGLSKALDIRAAKIQVQDGNWLMNGDSLEMLSDSSHISFYGPTAILMNFNGDTIPYHNVTYLSSGGFKELSSYQCSASFNVVRIASGSTLRGDNIFDTLHFAPGMHYHLEPGRTQHINHLEAIGDCFDKISIQSLIVGQQAILGKSSDTLIVDFVTLQDMDAQGGALFKAVNSLDKGNNTNWVIEAPSPVNHYWVGGSGDWSDPMHWSYTSGGAGGACIPTLRDDVFFDANSFSPGPDTVMIDMVAECRSMHWGGAGGQPIIFGSWPIWVFGSLHLTDSMQNLLTGSWMFRSDSLGNTIRTAGHSFIRPLYFQGGGSWDLLDSLTTQSDVYHIKGRINTLGNKLNAFRYYSDSDDPRVLDLDTSLFIIRSSALLGWIVDGTNMTILPGTSTIRFLQGAGMENKTGVHLDYHNVEFMSQTGSSLLRSSQIECSFNHVVIHNDGKIFGRNTFDSLTFFPDNTYQLDASLPQTIVKHWWVRGNNCFPVRLESTAYGDQAEVIKDTGLVTGDFIHMRDINASGGASFFAGANSSDIKNNTGWIFNNAPSYVYGFPEDTFLVKGTPFVLNTLNFNIGPGTTYLWGDGSTASTLGVSTPGTYYVTVTYDSNCSVSDSIIVFCRLGLDMSPTPTTCNAYADGAVDLGVQGSPSLYSYFWSTGDTTKDISGLTAGWYSVTVTDSVCYGVDSVEVTEPPVPAAHIPDTSFCEDTLITIHARPGFLTYEWSSGATTPWLTLDQGDSIWLVVTDSNGCVSVKFHALVTEDTLPRPFLGSDTCVTFDAGIWLEPGTFEEYLWQNGSTSANFEARWEGTYWVQVKSATCVAADTLQVGTCPAKMEVPNVFTPNGDGINDVFLPESRNIVLYKLMVFNRWGGLVFQSNDVSRGWDGRCDGGQCPEGTYFFTIDYSEFLQESVNHSLQGSVTLLR